MDNKANTIKKIFLIDDDYIYLSFTSKILNFLFPDSRVSSFNSAKSALSRLEKETPDVLFLDISMPEMDGWEFLEELKFKKIDFDIYVVSSSIDPEERERANSNPLVKMFLEKPLGKKQIERVFFSQEKEVVE